MNSIIMKYLQNNSDMTGYNKIMKDRDMLGLNIMQRQPDTRNRLAIKTSTLKLTIPKHASQTKQYPTKTAARSLEL